MAASVIDLSTLGASQGFIIQGESAGDWVGWSVSSAGDVNGDGIGDLIIGAPRSDNVGKDAGEAYVIFGQSGAMRADIDLSNLGASQGFIIHGESTGDTAGSSVSWAGDVNGDGIDDVIIGTDYGTPNAGDAYLVFGQVGAIRADVDLSSLVAGQGFIIRGDSARAREGFSVSSAGDVNGDGFDDVIIGARSGNLGGLNPGEAYVIFGQPGATRVDIDLSSFGASQGFIIYGDSNFDKAGQSVSSAGDINGDGIDDLIVGAPYGSDGGELAGEAYVIFGQSGAMRANIDLSNLGASQGFILQGDSAFDRAGYSVSTAGDLNGDGIDDLIVGAPYGDDGGANAGEAYVIFGQSGAMRADIDLSKLGASQGFIIQGDDNGDWAGFSVSSAGDVNGDGIDDVIVGAPNGDDDGTNAGEAYVIYGQAGATRADIDLSTLSANQGFIIQGDSANDRTGCSVSAAGDVNGDGFDDLIVGAYLGDNGGLDAGEAYVIYGGPCIGLPPPGPWSFAYDDPADMLLFSHFANDAYNGDNAGTVDGPLIRPAACWTAILTTWDGQGDRPVDDEGNIVPVVNLGVPGMEATAYREDGTGRVIVSYRGTDGEGELISTSIPLGLGLNEGGLTGLVVETTSYMQAAVDFYASLLRGVPAQGLDPVEADDIAFTGHSLGGMLAGYLTGITGGTGMIFATGPHSEMFEYLDADVIRPTDVGTFLATPDYDGLVATRLDGEVLGEAVEAALNLGWATFGRAVLSGNVALAGLSGLALLRWGDTTFEGENLDPMGSGLPETWLNSHSIHSMSLHQLTIYAQHSLGFSDYATVPDFLWSFYDDDVAEWAISATGIYRYSADGPAVQMFHDMVLAIQDGRENVLGQLLQDAEVYLPMVEAAEIGLGFSPSNQTLGFESTIKEAISAHLVENAARALLSESVDYATAQGLTLLGLGGEAGVSGEWLSLTPHGFSADNATWGLQQISGTIAKALGLSTGNTNLVDAVDSIHVMLNSAAGGELKGSAGNDLMIGALSGVGSGVVLDGAAGNDVLVGTSADDILTGGAGQNYLLGGRGDDQYFASDAANALTTISDLGGDDTLNVQGNIVGYIRGTGFAYIARSLSLEIGNQGARVDIFDHYVSRLLDGQGHIEEIINGDGSIWRPTTMIEEAFGVVRHTVNSVVSGTSALVLAVADGVDRIAGTVVEYSTRAVQVIGAGIEDAFEFAGSVLEAGSLSLRSILPFSPFQDAQGSAEPTSYAIDIDADLDGTVDATITLLGSYSGLGLSVTNDGTDTTMRLVLDPASQFDILGDDTVDDSLRGSGAADRIGGLGGNDTLTGRGGNDTLSGGAGHDKLNGGGGADVMQGGQGDDTYYVNHVDDLVIEYADEGNDLILSSVDYALLTPVENLVLTGARTISGVGNALDNRITGNKAANTLSGNEGQDRLIGKGGKDVLEGGAGDDVLVGGGAADVLVGGEGGDILNGGGGLDVASYQDAEFGLTVDLRDAGTNTGFAAGDTFVAIEGLIGSNLNDVLRGDSGANSIWGSAGNDRLEGRSGNDTLSGGAGNDTLIGGAGADMIDGGEGIDKVDYRASGAAVEIDLSEGTGAAGDAEGDTFTEVENVIGSRWGDTLTGSVHNNLLVGRGGADILAGGIGNDILNGGGGRDTITGGNGADTMRGNGGADRFVFLDASDSTVEAGGQDLIIGFSGQNGHRDRIDLSAFVSGGTYSGTGSFSLLAGEVISQVSGTDTLVMADVNGDGVADFALTLKGSVPLVVDDFLFG